MSKGLTEAEARLAVALLAEEKSLAAEMSARESSGSRKAELGRRLQVALAGEADAELALVEAYEGTGLWGLTRESVRQLAAVAALASGNESWSWAEVLNLAKGVRDKIKAGRAAVVAQHIEMLASARYVRMLAQGVRPGEARERVGAALRGDKDQMGREEGFVRLSAEEWKLVLDACKFTCWGPKPVYRACQSEAVAGARVPRKHRRGIDPLGLERQCRRVDELIAAIKASR